ncbi:hypothetical protein PV11_08920 [Exophiala sideris]|uniref:DUF7580 domain-containing protein n=1 Tax=Exophiala sideris TaxID=1016849 RepID=A0A0D1VM90_9EURO|nr:hypothetical protein PV11_08920 [Exophiala sideris]
MEIVSTIVQPCLYVELCPRIRVHQRGNHHGNRYILPLVVNQLDAYVQGIETLRGFGNKRYRRRIQDYHTKLETQHAVLLNSLEQSLEGVVDYEEDVAELIRYPRGPMWRDRAFQKKLANKLGRSHHAFVGTMTELSTSLEDLSRKLGLQAGDPSLKISRDDKSVLEQEIKKFKDIFSKSVYEDLLTKIEKANAALKTLVEQSHSLQESRRKLRVSKKPLLKHKAARKHAINLYNALVRGKYWKCPCRDSHCVHLRIDPRALDFSNDDDTEPAVPKLRIAFSSKTTASRPAPEWYWYEVETIPQLTETPNEPEQSLPSPPAPVQATNATRVRFAVVVSSLNSLPWPKTPTLPPSPPILDMCSTLCKTKADEHSKECIGSISDDTDASHRYYLHLVKRLDNSMETQSLEDMLSSSLDALGSRMARASYMLSRRDRLFLAATLASTVLRFSGSWLKSEWSIRDILFPKTTETGASVIKQPYLSGHAITTATTAISTPKIPTSTLIGNRFLFPLGLALIELSLCQTISSLRAPEDDDAIEENVKLKTASRLLDYLYNEFGGSYCDVVTKCLRWSETRTSEIDDKFQLLVFQNIVSPLFEALRVFDG